MLPLGSLVSMRVGELGFEEAGAPFGRACGGKKWPSGALDTPVTAAYRPRQTWLAYLLSAWNLPTRV